MPNVSFRRCTDADNNREAAACDEKSNEQE